MDSVGDVALLLGVERVQLVQVPPQPGHELRLVLPQHHRHAVGDGPLSEMRQQQITKLKENFI